MQFLSPLFWLGAIAVAAPIILHLIRREKADRILFASLMFLRRIPKKELKRQRLKYLLLLSLRCLGLLLLVSAFARPVATRDWIPALQPLAARSVVVLIDHSLSMSRGPLWDKALQTAGRRIQSLADADEVLLMQFGDSAEVLSPWEKPSARFRQTLERLASPGFESTSYAEGLRLAVEQLKTAKNGRKEIFLITDLQRAGLSGNPGWRVPFDIGVEVEDVGSDTSNLFVEEARLERAVFSGQYPHTILVRVGHSPARSLRGEAQLFLEGKLIDRQSFELAETGSGNVSFKPFEVKEGVSRGKIVIEPTDSLPQDNLFFFVIEKSSPRTILVVTGGEGSTFYFENALAAGQNLPFHVQAVKSPGSNSINPSETPVVVIDGPQEPPPRLLFERYLNEGGSVIIASSNQVRPQAYNKLEWMPASLLERNFTRTQKVPFTSITEASWEHPVFAVFQDVHRAGIISAQFYGYWKLLPAADATVLARFSGGDPALVERNWGKGKVLLFASSLDPVWNDLPLRSVYVPLWHQLVQYAAGWRAAPAALKINQVLPVEAATASATASAETTPRSRSWNVIDPRGQRVLGLGGEAPEFIPLKLPGHYEIRSNKDTDWVAVNCEPAESDLSRVSRQEFLAALVPRAARMSALTVPQETLGDRERQQSLWWFVLIAAALILGVESWLANVYYGQGRD